MKTIIKQKIAVGLIGALFIGLTIYLVLPVFATWFVAPIFYTIIIGLIISFLFLKGNENNHGYVEDTFVVTKTSKNILYGVVTIFITSILFAFITTTTIFHAKGYRNVIGKVKEINNFDSVKLSVSVDQVRIVDEKMATKLGDKKLGEEIGLGSSSELGDFHIQKVKDQLFWVAPLEHRGFFKWLNSEGTPGYVMVSATNEKDVRLILTLNGKPLSIKYQLGAYGFENLKRYIYSNGYNDIGLTDYSFELNDHLEPFYVVTTYEKTVGFSGENANGVLVVNVQNGEIKQYTIDNAPKWIDRIQPENIINIQLDDWGEFIHGWWNSTGFTEQKEVLNLSSSQSLIYGENGKSYWYSAMSSVGRDESIVGFLLTDTRTKESFFVRQAGATERSAKNSAEGKVQEKGYIATQPILYNINGIPTYVMTLKDKEGLIKLIAMVSVEKYSIVGIGNNIQAALRDYKSELYSNGNSINLNTGSKNFDNVKGYVEWVKVDVNKGKSYYYFKIKDTSLIFVGTSDISERLVLTDKGDQVEVIYKKTDSFITDIIKFTNDSILKRVRD